MMCNVTEYGVTNNLKPDTVPPFKRITTHLEYFPTMIEKAYFIFEYIRSIPHILVFKLKLPHNFTYYLLTAQVVSFSIS